MADKIPDYALDALQGFLNYSEESNRLLHISMQGISTLSRMPPLVRAIAEWSPPDHNLRSESAMQNADRIADFATKEIESGFPLLHAHTLVGLWGALEAAVGDMLLGILLNEPELLQDDCFRKVRIPLAEFETLEREDRMRLLLEEISRTQGSAHKQGVDKFEALLDTFQLSGAVDDQIKKTLWEMSHLRNAIVHRCSIADRRLLKACPWLGLKVGDKIIVTHGALEQYLDTLCAYFSNIGHRLARRYNPQPPSKAASASAQSAPQPS